MRKLLMDRRQFLRTLGYGGLAFAGQRFLSACSDVSTQAPQQAFQGDPDVEIRLTAKPDVHLIFPGEPTQVWRYEGEVLKGPPNALVSHPESYLGPTFQIETGTKVRIYFDNLIGEPSIIHWHGLHVPEAADGHPRFAVKNGHTYQYDFQVMDRAGTYWYHPHPHGRTGPQVYRGLAGLFLIHDEEETALDLPSGDWDLPLVIQDRVFDRENQLRYSTTDRMTQMVGMLGDEILVNGVPEYTLDVDRRPYRLRLLNGSNARIYKLAWDDGTPMTVIGTDGGLLEVPILRKSVTLAPAQRIELWVDFSNRRPGTTLRMLNLPSSAPGSRSEMLIFTVSVQDTDKQPGSLPAQLTQHHALDPSQAVNAEKPRSFLLAMGRGMRWTINGRQFEMTEVARDESVRLGEIEVWEFANQVGGGMGMMGGMQQPHPMHVHGLQFKILERYVGLEDAAAYSSLQDGFVDEGWHDTVLVLPGERVKILMRFEDFAGLYLYHCHNLEHEDMGMMRNYQIK